MPIPNYVRPQLTIEQILAELPSPTADRLVPIVIGPQYLLSRYSKETTYNEIFNASGQSLAYKYYDDSDALQDLPNGYAVDLDFVKLYGVGLEAQLAEFTASGANFQIESLINANVLEIQTNILKGTGTLNASFLGREVEIGDIVYVYETDVTSNYKRRVVVGFKGQDVAATRGNATNGAYNPATDATADSSIEVSKPSGWTITTSGTLNVNVAGGSVLGTKLGEEFTITVRTPGAAATATVDISSKSGNYSASNVATASDGGTGFDITNTNAGGELAGIDINLDTGSSTTLTTGETFIVQVFQAYERANDGDTDQITTAGTFTGSKDTTYLLRVKTGVAGGDTATGAVLEITDTAGIDTPATVTVTDASEFNVGTFGVKATIGLGVNTLAQGGLVAGDVYVIACTAAGESTTTFDKVILDGPAVDTTTFSNASNPVKVQFRKGFTGKIESTDAAAGAAWSADADSIDLNAGLALYVDERTAGNKWVPYVDAVGKIHTTYRAILPAPESENKIGIETTTDINTKLGTIDLDNDLAFGANEALSGIQGTKKIWALRTGGTKLADYIAALKKIEATDMLYAICPLTDNLEIQKAVAEHCDNMSSKNNKNFRRCYVATDSPGSYAVLSVKDDLTNYTATIGDYAGSNVLLTTADDVDFRILNLEAGDLVKLTSSGDEYKISYILSATEIILQSGPVAPISPAVPFQLWRADTASSQKDYVIARSEAIDSRRCSNIWVDKGTRLINGVTTVIPNRFVAAEIAGLRCAILPQQGLTNTEVNSITDATLMFIRYTQDELDEIAAAGTFIVTQNAESSTIHIRHQITTEVDHGSLYYEDSVGVNLDDISFKVKDALTGFIGKKNVNAKTLNEMELAVLTILNSSTTTPANASYGPALNGYEDLLIAVHPTLKDRITVYAKLLIPLPLNNIEVTLEGDVDLSL